mgnify:CR=1 FL=1
MNEKEHQRAADVEEARAKLLECFPGSFIRDSDDVGYEFIAHPRTNQSFILEDCHSKPHRLRRSGETGASTNLCFRGSMLFLTPISRKKIWI